MATTVTPNMIKELRERTAAGLMDCKKALVETDGVRDRAIESLRKRGLAAAAKKAGRLASEGVVTAYVHSNNRVGVLLEVNCETDFVAQTPDFKQFCADVAMQIAAMNPAAVRREDMDTSKVESERVLLREKAFAEGKPEKMVDRIVDGQIGKFYSEHVLLEQKFVKDDKKTIEQVQQETVAKLGETNKTRRSTRYEPGGGLEKKNEDFPAEVAAQVAAAKA